MAPSVEAIRKEVEAQSKFVARLRDRMARVIVGQQYMVDRLLVGLLANGHVLIEGVPGLAKTTAVKTLAQAMNCSFSRIQFTPDLLPADLIGTLVYSPKDGEFTRRRGRSSPTSFWRTKSTGRRRRCRARSSKPCRSAR